MRFRTIGVIAAMMLFATACEDASGGIGQGSIGDPQVVAPVGPTDTAPDTGDGSGSAAPVPVAAIPPPAPTTSAPAPSEPPSTTSTSQPPSTTSTSQPPSTTSTTTSTPPTTTLPPSDDGWPVLGPVAGRTTITGSGNWVVDYRDYGTPWHIHDVDIVADGGHAVGPPGAVGGGVMENASVVVDGGDNIKIATDGVYRNLYLRMATAGGHIDAMQSQGNSGWLIDNVVIEIPSPSPSVTGAIIIENLRGGGAGYRDVVGTINRLKLIGTGPWHHDIRLQNNPAATMTVTITNVDWSDAHPDSVLLLTGTPATLTVYVDDSVPDSRIKGAANATVIRI